MYRHAVISLVRKPLYYATTIHLDKNPAPRSCSKEISSGLSNELTIC